MTFRWYGKGYDSVSLSQIKQIPGIDGVICTLHGKLPGEAWRIEDIQKMKQDVEQEGLKILGIESVPVHDAIKSGSEDRDQYIDHYIETIKNLAACDIHVVCYSFKPIFGWARTTLSQKNEDGSYSMSYDQSIIDGMESSDMFKLINSQSKGFKLPGWEEERLKHFHQLEKRYEGITEEKLFDNLSYFLKRIIPICEQVDVKMAIHPDDPPWEIFNYPRITKNIEDLKRIVNIIDSPSNGITFCTGSLGASPSNRIVDMVHELQGKINFVHLRNVKHLGDGMFKETAHPSQSGSLDMYEITKALIETNFDGIIRPDHGRTIWNEESMPGYGLYDRALGVTYLLGLIEAIEKN